MFVAWSPASFFGLKSRLCSPLRSVRVHRPAFACNRATGADSTEISGMSSNTSWVLLFAAVCRKGTTLFQRDRALILSRNSKLSDITAGFVERSQTEKSCGQKTPITPWTTAHFHLPQYCEHCDEACKPSAKGMTYEQHITCLPPQRVPHLNVRRRYPFIQGCEQLPIEHSIL
jgi:hypothetical protein